MFKRAALVLILLPLLLSACTLPSLRRVRGSGRVVTENRELSAFTGVTLATLGDLTVELGEEESLRIEMEDNLLPYLQVEVRNGMLTIRFKPGASITPTRPIRFQLTASQLDTLVLSSLGSVQAPELRAGRFTVKVSSLGSCTLAALNADSLDVTLTSLGNLEIGGGQVGTQRATLTSTGSYRAGDLRSRSADVTVNSLGSATVWATDTLNAHLTSTGDVSYYGNPRVTSQRTSLGQMKSLGSK